MSTAHSRACSPLETARELAPAIRRAATEIEQMRALPRPLFEQMADTGLFHMLIPRQLGGAELDLPTYIQVVEELGKADASTAWCVNQGGVWATHAVCVPPALAREIWVDTPRGVVANTPAPTATAIPVEGGYRITGRQGFSTGSPHASWIAARGRIIEDGEARRRPDGTLDIRFFMMPVGEVELLDTWHTRGLRGTGPTISASPIISCQRRGRFPRTPRPALSTARFTLCLERSCSRPATPPSRLGTPGAHWTRSSELAGAKTPVTWPSGSAIRRWSSMRSARPRRSCGPRGPSFRDGPRDLGADLRHRRHDAADSCRPADGHDLCAPAVRSRR